MHLYTVYGILLIVPIVDFALATPVLVQEKRQACDDMVGMATYPITVLEKRSGIDEEGMDLIENWIPKPIENYIPIVKSEEPPHIHGSSSSTSLEPAHVETNAINAPLTGSVNPTYFHPDNELPGVHTEAQTTPTDLGSDRILAEEPPSPTKGSSTESDFEMVHRPPLTPAPSSTESDFEMVDVPSSDPNHESMRADSPGDLQTEGYALKGQEKESRSNSDIARDVGNLAYRGGCSEKSLDSTTLRALPVERNLVPRSSVNCQKRP